MANQLKEKIDKYYKLPNDELVSTSVKNSSSLSEDDRNKVLGIWAFYKSKNKLTDGQKESLVRLLALNN